MVATVELEKIAPIQNQCLTPNIIYRADVRCEANKDN